MKIIDDNLLNNFIDNDLSIEEKQFIQSEIDKNPEIKKRYENLLLIHNSLKNSEISSTSIDFTKTLMQKISKRELRSVQQKRFLFVMLSIFGIVTVGIVGFLFYQLISTITFNDSNELVTNYSKIIGDYFTSIFGKKNLSIFGSVLSFIMLVAGYFLFDYQKQSKKKFSH